MADGVVARPRGGQETSGDGEDVVSGKQKVFEMSWLREYGRTMDWAKLAEKDAEVRGCCRWFGDVFALDFGLDEARRVAARACLEHDFGLRWQPPSDGRLVPCVPNRVAYLLWTYEAVLGSPLREIRAIDVGTGASCIYPLLGARLFGWRFVATEADPEAAKEARANAALNSDLDVGVVDVSADDAPLTAAGQLEADVSIVNPPFFESEAAWENACQGAPRPKNGRAPASSDEAVYSGGELALAKKIAADPCPVRWRTTLFGRKASQASFIAWLEARPHVVVVKSHAFRLGRTTRYLVAWTSEYAAACPDFDFVFNQDLAELRRRLQAFLPGDYTVATLDDTISASSGLPLSPDLVLRLSKSSLSYNTVVHVALAPRTLAAPKALIAAYAKLRDALPGEITRTNRRWRRRLRPRRDQETTTTTTSESSLKETKRLRVSPP